MTFNPIRLAISVGSRFRVADVNVSGEIQKTRHKSVQTRKKMRNRKDRKAR